MSHPKKQRLSWILVVVLRPPHEHRWDLAESEELVTFWILRVFDGKRVGFF